MTPAQCRAARGLLNWTQSKLAAAARVGGSTVRSFETGRSVPVPKNLIALRGTLEKAGVEFTYGDGVRLAVPKGDGAN
jgi:transcriptional regulator with XRE-family HTH domain